MKTAGGLRLHGVGEKPLHITLLARSDWTPHGVRAEAHALVVALRSALSATAYEALREEIRERPAPEAARE